MRYVSVNEGVKEVFNAGRWSSFNKEVTRSEAVDTAAVLDRKDRPVTQPFNKTDSKKGQKSKPVKKETEQSKTNNSGSEFAENWFECWQANNASVVLNYGYHPAPVLEWSNSRLPTVKYLKSLGSPDFNCEQLSPDLILLEIELGPSVVLLYGAFLKRLWFIKESFFGWDQFYNEMTTSETDSVKRNVSRPFRDLPFQLLASNQNDPRNFRPLSVKLSLAIHNINGHLVTDLPSDLDPALHFPIAFTDRIALELDKTYRETRLQLFIDPVNVFVSDTVKRAYDQGIGQGHLSLSAVQVRGHAMFSDEGRVKTDTLEYAWLLEILLGDITGHVTPAQTTQVVNALELALKLILEDQFSFEPVFADRVDPGLPFKYEVTRFSIDSIDLFLVECATALNLKVLF